MTDTPQYLCLKQAQAAKTGERSTGRITYAVLCDADRQSLYLTLTGNESGGWFSNEIVPLTRIEEVLDALPDREQALSSKCLRPAFISQSVNNWGFLGAVLRAEQLLMPAPDAPHQHVLAEADDWDTWKSVMLSEPGVPYVPLVKGAKPSAKPEIAVAKEEGPPAPHGKRQGRKKGKMEQKDSDVDVPPSDQSTAAPDADPVLDADAA